MKYLLGAIAICLFLVSCDQKHHVRVQKKFAIDSAWHEKNPNGIPPDLEGKNKILVRGSVITTPELMKRGDSITLYYYK